MTNEKAAPSKTLWYEEYRTCSCSFLARDKALLPGYCPRHGTNKKLRTRVDDVGYEDEELGYAG